MTERPQQPSFSFSTEEYLATRFTQLGRQFGLRARSQAELYSWQAELRARLRDLIGLGTHRHCELAPERDAIERCDGYTRHRITIAVEPGLRMPLYVLRPGEHSAAAPYRAVIATHGHGGGGKESVAGRADNALIAAAIRQYHYDYGVQLVRAGFVVFCPDARGFGERREASMLVDNDILGSSCQAINNMAMPLGQTVTGMLVWDLMCLIDYITRCEDCTIERLACVGLSGGGLQALWLSALDERVRCAIVSGYFYGYKDALLHMNRNCSCNYVPGLWQLLDMGDLAALIAPRRLLIESGRRDHHNGACGLENVHEQLAITRQAYELLGVPDDLAHSVFEGEHRWDGKDAVAWLES